MYICICNAVKENDIIECIKKNKDVTLRKICCETEAGQDCGKCVKDIKKILNENINERK